MAENLNYDSGQSWCYDNEPSNCDVYGRLYDWATTVGMPSSANESRVKPSKPVHGICPDGWHVPSESEWLTLIEAAGGKDDGAPDLRATSDEWQHGSSSNDTGFSALPGGYKGPSRFVHLGFVAQFQSSKETGNDTAAFMFLSGSDRARVDDDTNDSGNDKLRGRSVRCIADA